MKRRIVAFLCAVGWLLSLTACGGTGAVSSDVSDVPNESDEFVPDTTTTLPPTTTTTTTAPPTTIAYDEPKTYSTHTVDEDFKERELIVVMQEKAPKLTGAKDKAFFSPYLSPEEIVGITPIGSAEADNNYNQMLKITIRTGGKAAVIDAIKKIEQHPAVVFAEPNGIGYAN